MNILKVIREVPVYRLADASVIYLTNGQIDGDGSGDPHNDPDFQARTSYRNEDENGIPRWCNADTDNYIVWPPALILAVPEKVLGCRCRVTNIKNGRRFLGIVGDTSDDRPTRRIGELSIAYANALEIPSSPTTGGTDEPILVFEVWPGVPGFLNGKTVALQSYRE